MKPRLPEKIEQRFPADLLTYMYKFVPHIEKRKTPSVSPQLQKDLRAIQSKRLKGMSELYMRDFVDFLLD